MTQQHPPEKDPHDANPIDGIDYSFLLLVHTVCADRRIHSKESKALRDLSTQSTIGQSTLAEMDKILSQYDNYLSLQDVAYRVPPGQQDEVIRKIVAVAYVDGFFAPLEREMIDRVAHIWNWSTGETDRIVQEVQEATIQSSISNIDEQSNLSSEARLLDNCKKFGLPDAFINIVKNLAPDTFGRKIEQLEREILLSGPEYDEAIEQCARVAKEDYKYTKIALEKTNFILENLWSNLSQVAQGIQHQNNSKGKASNAKKVTTELETSTQHLTTKIITNLESVKQSTFAKQRALNYFSIAFIGKTKAGKSTLHAILTQNGWESIGVGKQRTTRLIREYEWKNIRIIDTPGISAPMEGGKTDEETTKSVIGESDIICYVVTNDSTQDSELKFLKGLKEKAKPLIILLNIKRNLRNPQILEDFFKNPSKEFAMDGNSKLPGHFNRILSYAKEHYANDYFPIVPVMLIAAQLSCEAEHQKYKKKLFEASRIQDFLDLIRESLIKYGTITRSQTLLGSTVGEIEEPAKWVTQEAQKYKQLVATLRTERENINKKLKQAVKDNQKSLLQKIEAVYLQAKNAIPTFAEDNYNSNKVSLELAWKKELEKINFAKRLKAAYQETNQSFNNDVKEELEEVGHELQLIANLDSFDFDCEKQDTINFRDLFRIGGSILVLAGAILAPFFPPVGIVMGIGATFIGGIAGFFKTKNEKRREAVQNVTNSLSSQIIIHKQNTLQHAKDNFTKSCDSVVTTIDNYFKDLIQGLEEISTHLESAQKGLDSAVNYLNRAYAKRIIDWSTEQYEPLNDEGINKTIAKVKREFGNAITIQTRTETQLKKSQEEMKQILQEDIFIETISY